MRFIFPVLLILFSFNLYLSQANNLVINEIMSKNETILADQNGDYPDWIELYNSGEKTIFIKDYYLSDDKNNKIKWKFPDVEIQPKSFLLVFLSGKDKFENGEIHTNFKLDSDGEEIFLLNDLDFELDRVPEISLGEDESFGRLPDGTGEFVRLANPSPNYSNNENDKLEISHKSGFYEKPFDLEIKSKSGYDIFYTLDGSVPTTKSQKYTKPIKMDYRYLDSNYLSEFVTSLVDSLIYHKPWESPSVLFDKANVLKAASFKSGKIKSEILTQTFFVDSLIYSKYNLPVISLIMDERDLFGYDSGMYVPGVNYDPKKPAYYPSGNYHQRGKDWERPVHFEYFEKYGKSAFSQNAGIRLHGGKAREAAQKSFRLYARDKYGKSSFDYPFFASSSQSGFKTFVLRATMRGVHIQTFIQDELASEIVRDIGFEFLDYNPTIVFINGEYWGIHSLRERMDKHLISQRFGIDKDSIDIIGMYNVGVEEGSDTHYKNLLEWLEMNDMQAPSSFEYISSQIDIGNYIDYQIAEIYLNNWDWPENNIKYWRPQRADGKWRWIFYDLDIAFEEPDYPMMEHATNAEENGWPNQPYSTYFFRKLLENDEFQYKFIERFSQHLKTTFQYHIVKEKFEMIKNMYSAEVPRHINRWNYPDSFEKWEEDIDKYLLKFLEERSCYMQEQIEEFFELDNFDFSCFFDYTDKDTIPTYQDKVELEFYDNIIKVENYYENLLNINVKVFALRGEEIYSGNYNISHGIERIDLGEKLIRGMYIISVEYLDTRKSFKIYKL
jgi:CotH kinase protein/Lamin Tail Domain/Fn3 associated